MARPRMEPDGGTVGLFTPRHRYLSTTPILQHPWELGAGNWTPFFGGATLEGCDSTSLNGIAGLKATDTSARGTPPEAGINQDEPG